MHNRRSFLKNLGAAGTLLALPSAILQAEPLVKKEPLDLSTLTIRGHVHTKGKGISGVSVTDGFNITQTDNKGNYELLSNKTAEFIYISIPAGFAINHKKGIADFYQPLDKSSTKFNADFSLNPLGKSDLNHNFVVWADPQIISKSDAEQLKTRTAPDLLQLVKSYPQDTLFHGIGCGDLVWDHFELFEDYRTAVETTGIPFYNVIGNHDMDLDARTDELSAQTFKKQFGPTYYSFNRGEIHYVVLDDVFFIGTAKKYIGYLTEQQLQWLEQDLAFVKKGTTLVLSLHIPTNTGSVRRNNLKEDELGGVVSNRERLYKIMEGYTVHIMSGHTHMNEKWTKGNITEHVHGTVCGAWWTGPVCSDGSPEGYAVYEVQGSQIQWFYKSIGKPRDHQVKVYPKGFVKDSPDEIIANVWNWDANWKIEWLEDGVLKGEMERRTALDPLAEKLYNGPQLPKKHKWIDPTLTDHLFFAKPSSSAKLIEIKATDRFGKIYVEKLSL
ncbi:calcineurin-like phosphoesterase C-terminal domain-containing protein [Arcticibacter eurypsychrophilus]|uniref:calcineurin-like phosphoesterase C-terminal domain-containing protein n=1 Tax=Arcticibacter eurypsychrophilus TaxID=1434752 RepID=UPI00084DA312|nr:calcineurin-like phosphoesterase family protein [Arcticibacter eurypsychrophilus]